MKHRSEGTHTVHTWCILKIWKYANMQMCKYEEWQREKEKQRKEKERIKAQLNWSESNRRPPGFLHWCELDPTFRPPGPSAPPPIATLPASPSLPRLCWLPLLPLSRIFRFCLNDRLSFMIWKSITETFSINQMLCGTRWVGSEIYWSKLEDGVLIC
jgi:hypothetical protein